MVVHCSGLSGISPAAEGRTGAMLSRRRDAFSCTPCRKADTENEMSSQFDPQKQLAAIPFEVRSDGKNCIQERIF